MQSEPHSLEYRSPRRAERVRPQLWLSHMRTAAALCPFALFVDAQLRYDSFEARQVVQIEVALAIYGATCAIVSVARGLLTKRDKATVALCMLVYIVTGYVGVLMPRVIHN